MSENTDLYDLAAQRLTEYMKGKNIRKTPERFEILRIICRTPGIFNIDKLQELMEENAKFQVSRVTLFNTLKLFEDASLVIKHTLSRAAHYECCVMPHPMVCLVCQKCGTVFKIDLPYPAGEQCPGNFQTVAHRGRRLLCAGFEGDHDRLHFRVLRAAVRQRSCSVIQFGPETAFHKKRSRVARTRKIVRDDPDICHFYLLSKRCALRPRGEFSEGGFSDAIRKVCGASTQTLRVKDQLIRGIFHSYLLSFVVDRVSDVYHSNYHASGMRPVCPCFQCFSGLRAEN